MKGAKFTFLPDSTSFEVYNTGQNCLYCIMLNKKGERRSPNAKTLKTFSATDFAFGIETGGIVML